MDWNCFSGSLNQFFKPVLDELYPKAKSMHFTCCKPFWGNECATLTVSGKYWLAMKETAEKRLELSSCKSED